MPPVPFALRRTWFLTRDLFISSRADPDVESLRRVDDAETFVWRILPHAARTFATCITVLPADFARATAVAYLYCRVLDTYEDLLPHPAREHAMADFGARFRDGAQPVAATKIDPQRAREPRDKAHILLVDRVELLDEMYRTLPDHERHYVHDLVADMAEGMIWASQAFAQQGGVLKDGAQLSRYCRTVIGLPFVFAAQLLLERRRGDGTLAPSLEEDLLQAGEMVQLANITRDVEKDLKRGIAYHPLLAGDVGRTDVDDPALRERVRRAREELLVRALSLAPAYERVMATMPFGAVSLARASGSLMLLFTDRHYRSCARQVGRTPWRGFRSTTALILLSAIHVFSGWSTRKAVAGIVRRWSEVRSA